MSNKVMSENFVLLFVFIPLTCLECLVKGQGLCSDKLNNCEQYGAAACSNYKQWARENCCGYCRLSPSLQSCSDKLTNCADYGSGSCTSYTKWASTNCCKYCADNAHPSSGTARPGANVPVCRDKIIDCPSYGSDICRNFVKWARDNCCAYCRAVANTQNLIIASTTPTIHTSLATHSPTCNDDFSAATCQRINACNDPKYRQYCKRYCNLCCHDNDDGTCSKSNACTTIVSALKCKQTCGLCHCHDKLDCSPFRTFCLKDDEITLKCADTCGLCGNNLASNAFG